MCMLVNQNHSRLTDACRLWVISILTRPHFSIYGKLCWSGAAVARAVIHCKEGRECKNVKKTFTASEMQTIVSKVEARQIICP